MKRSNHPASLCFQNIFGTRPGDKLRNKYTVNISVSLIPSLSYGLNCFVNIVESCVNYFTARTMLVQNIRCQPTMEYRAKCPVTSRNWKCKILNVNIRIPNSGFAECFKNMELESFITDSLIEGS